MNDTGTRNQPSVTYSLLAIITLIQIYVTTLPEPQLNSFYGQFALFPFKLFNGVSLEALVTYMFLHGGWMHLFLNSLSLLSAGSIVERELGSAKFSAIYIFSGVAAGFVHCYFNSSSTIPVAGASGAIFGIIAVLFLLMPFKITFTLLVPLPSVIVGILLSAVELSAIWLSVDIEVAHYAHLGGFLFGGLSAFAIDFRRAMKGVIIAIVVFAILYFVGYYLQLT